MQNKKLFLFGLVVCGVMMMTRGSWAVQSFDVAVVEEDIDFEQMSADAIDDYRVAGSLFERITDLEQEKVVMQLEKELAQLNLELDRLAAEKIKLHMEIDTLSGRAEQQQQEIETQKAKLEAEAARIEREKEAWLTKTEEKSAGGAYSSSVVEEKPETNLSKKYRLMNVVGAGAQLQATVEDLTTGQSKRISVGKSLDGFVVKSISVDDGVVFVDAEGNVQNLNVSNGK